MTSIYGDNPQQHNPITSTNYDCVIEFDLSGPKQSLLELVRSVKDVVDTRPDEATITLYFVAGKNLTDNDWSALIDYIAGLPNPINVAYRGYIHPESFKILTNFNTLSIDKDGKFLYLADKLNLMLKLLTANRDRFRSFLERWIEKYHEVERAEYGIDELRALGFEFETI